MDEPVSPFDVALSRRGLIALAAGAPLLVVGLAAVAHAEEAPAICVDLDTLPASQKGMRRSIGFRLHSPDPKKHCSLCTFFTGAAAGCGKCQLLSGGSVAATSLCDSFAARA
ncbi:hypothetical protein GCM10009087_20740 [Sphingomonas oligophenolica]|uniref:High-potential iron-sulfur protein n=1 Tax=Sphingomonas oligophenolica TaxID=301154 RepID=A0ABU9Y3Z7_9SPHN